MKETLVWGTAAGAWGDVLACLGEFRNYPQRGGMIVYGRDPKIADFVSMQAGVEAVHFVEALEDGEYRNICCDSAASDDWKWEWSFLPHIRRCKVIPTHLRPAVTRANHVNRWHGGRLDFNSHAIANEVILHNNLESKPFIVLQPYSTQSSEADTHWQHWEEAIEILLRCTPYQYVLIGQGYEIGIENPKLTNLIDKMPDMMTVYALAERASGVVSTCNSLAMWSVINQIPTVVCANEALHQARFFWKWIDCEPVTLLPVTANTFDFMRAFKESIW